MYQSRLKPVRKQTLYEQIFEEVKRFIINNNLQAGDRLPTERQMAETLSVSRHSVREALKSLEFMGVLTSGPRNGYIMQPFTLRPVAGHIFFRFPRQRSEIPQFIEARNILEMGAIDLAIANGKEWHFDRMERHARAAEEKVDDQVLFADTCARFRDALFEATGNELFRCLYEIVAESFRRCAAEMPKTGILDRKAIASAQMDLVEAIIAGDSPKAKAAAAKCLAYDSRPEAIDAMARALLPALYESPYGTRRDTSE